MTQFITKFHHNSQQRSNTITIMESNENDHPAELKNDYEHIRPLGKGAFGVVWLARAKKNDNNQTGNDNPYVVIKQIHLDNGNDNGSDKKYAEREIAILSEINHPNVVRCLRSITLPHRSFLVLTLADGPDLQQLVDKGGALSVPLGRLSARDLIAAVSYLHTRGVMHRDIKPANCILAKSNNHDIASSNDDWLSNDIFWDDNSFFQEWKVVLVDFGFAKALTPEEVGYHEKSNKRPSVVDVFDKVIGMHAIKQKNPIKKRVSKRYSSINPKKMLRRTEEFELISHRGMSALGTKAFTAPEVKKIRDKSKNDHALSNMVSDYGLIADAYSIGATIKVLLTGVPADQNEMAFISANDSMFNTIFALLSCKKDGGRKRRYKFLDELPKEAANLVHKLMKPDFMERISVPLARDEVWIKGGMDTNDPTVTLAVGDVPAGNNDHIQCLKCANDIY